MALTILEKNGTYEVEGRLNVNTAKNFQSHCEALLNSFGELTINIEKTSQIDVDGMKAIGALFTHAITNQRSFYVVGYGCKDIYDELKPTILAA
ncbi:MAG: hypothetical protein ED556_09525 [Winogradskyella sp.]|uniref:hypothetical protein n=1 Tax=Winogradskyella sp. TaxID=1883156 RepID=UPI000F3EDDA3|nr:hypothetical protein [Winogradskyella sp.]RNC86514.1 MAG: hypothetical protein ED556_09525 [Winogradskyella sp.]